MRMTMMTTSNIIWWRINCFKSSKWTRYIPHRFLHLSEFFKRKQEQLCKFNKRISFKSSSNRFQWINWVRQMCKTWKKTKPSSKDSKTLKTKFRDKKVLSSNSKAKNSKSFKNYRIIDSSSLPKTVIIRIRTWIISVRISRLPP